METKGMHSHHHHHHHDHSACADGRTLLVCILLNLLFVLIETASGMYYNSVGLISDAGHNLGDVFSLVLALVAMRMARVKAGGRFTYGYRKSTVLVSLVNAVILLVAVGAIMIESVYRFDSDAVVSGQAVSWTAGAGIVINGLTAWLLMKGSHKDMNMRGAFLHMLADTLVSAGVVVSGLAITFLGWNWADPVVSIAIAAVILVSTLKLLMESLQLSMDAVPHTVDMERLRMDLDGSGVKDWHHLHVWAISTTENAATVHVVVGDLAVMESAKAAVRDAFARNGITHTTVECELPGEECSSRDCI